MGCERERVILLVAVVVAQLLAAPPVSAKADDRPNVLFIIADDLRDELGCYGDRHIHSPHIDSLARRGTTFASAYCQYALCGPSRASIFSGQYPRRNRVFNNRSHFRDHQPDAISLPQHFKNHRYRTRGIGKILHDTKKDDVSWTDGHFFDNDHVYASDQYRGRQALIDGSHPENKRLPLWEGPDVSDSAYRDGRYTGAATESLREYAEGDRPFFLMVGYHKPHTPFNAPKKYWDLYNRDSIPLAGNQYPPAGAPAFAVAGARYVRTFKDIPQQGRFSDPLQRQIKHAYFACIAYIDAQVGILLRTLDELGLAENTIVVFTSDHGYQLGEHDLWCKHTNFETSTKVPLIVAAAQQAGGGKVTDARVELIDLTPTLSRLCGLPAPAGTDGESFAPLLDDPNAWSDRDTIAISRYHRSGNLGLSVRSRDYRYTQWRSSKTGELVAHELYDHRRDHAENTNVVDRPKYAEVVAWHGRRLQQHRSNVPGGGRVDQSK